MSVKNYQIAQYNDIVDDVNKFFSKHQTIGIKELSKINFWINKAKNNDFTEKLFELLDEYTYNLDFEKFVFNFNDFFDITGKENDDYLQVKDNVNNILYILQNFEIEDVKSKKQDLKNFLNKLFDISNSPNEKKQIMEIISKYVPEEINNDVRYKDYKNVSADNLNKLKKQKNLEEKTNGFYSVHKSNSKNRFFLGLKKIFHKQLNLIDDSKIKLTKDIADKINEIIEDFRCKKEDIEAIKNDIDGVFDLNEIDFNDEDYVLNIQLKKIKIFLLQKLFNSFKENENSAIKYAKIRKILDIKKEDIDEKLFDFFSKNCDITNVYDEIDFNNLLTAKDVLKSFSEEDFEIKQDTIQNLFNNHNLYNKFSFVEIKEANAVDSDNVYYKEQQNSDLERTCVIFCNQKQKQNIIKQLFFNTDVCKKVEKVKSKFENCDEITDFAKMVIDTQKNPVLAENYLDIYKKFFGIIENNGIGGLLNDKSFSIKEDSNENFIRNDFSKYTVSSNILLEMLKIQALTGNPINEIKINVDDIEKLPQVLDEYYKFIINKRDVDGNLNLTPALKLTVKSNSSLTKDEMDKLYLYLNDLSNFKVCFKELRIDNKEFNNYLKENDLKIQNQYVLCGYNDIFIDEQNIDKKQIQHEENIFDKVNARPFAIEYTKPNIEDGADIEFNNLNVNYQEKYDILSKKIIEKSTKSNVNAGVSTETNTQTDTDVDLKMIIELNKKPEELKGFNDKDAITEFNIEERMDDLLSNDNNRFPEQTKRFLLNFQKNSSVSWKEIFRKITSRDNFSTFLQQVDKKGFNYRFTPEAFFHLVNDYLKIGMTRWNGDFGDPEIQNFTCKDEKGIKLHIVGMRTKDVETVTTEPIMQLYSALPARTTEGNNEKLIYKENQKFLDNFENLGLKLKQDDNIYAIFYNNIKKSSLEYQSYIGENFKELDCFIDKINKNSLYFNICKELCKTLSRNTDIGDIKHNFVLVDPLKLARGLNQFFNLLDSLKKENFIDDENIKEITKYLNTKDPYLIQQMYILLVKRKIKVAKTIIAFRKNILNQQINININDDKEVYNYISKNGLNDVEIEYSKYDFKTLVKLKKNKSALKMFDDFFDSGGVLNDLFSKQQEVELLVTKSKVNKEILNTIHFKYPQKDINYLFFVMNKKYNRLPDGSLNEPSLTNAQKKIIQSKVDITLKFNQMNNMLQQIQDKNSEEYRLLKGQIDLFSKIFINCFENEKDVDVEFVLNKINGLTMEGVVMANHLKQQNNSSSIYKIFKNIVDIGEHYTKIENKLSAQTKLKWALSKTFEEREKFKDVYFKLFRFCKSSANGNLDQSFIQLNNQFLNEQVDNFNIYHEVVLAKSEVDNYGADSVEKQIYYYLYPTEQEGKVKFADFLDVDLFIQKELKNIENEPTNDDKINKLERLLKVYIAKRFSIQQSKIDEIAKDLAVCVFYYNVDSIANNYNNIVEELNNLEDKDAKDLIRYTSLYIGCNKNNNLGFDFFRDFISYKKQARSLNLDFDINELYNLYIQPDFFYEEHDIRFLCSNVLELSQKKTLLNKYNQNNLILVNNVDYYYKKDLSAKLSRKCLQNIIAKAIYRNNCNKEKIRLVENILNFAEKISELYKKADNLNNLYEKNKYLNIIGKLETLVKNETLNDINRIVEQISSKVEKNNDILNYIDYLTEHKDAKYEDVEKLYSINSKEKYLNTGYTHAELMKIAKYNEDEKEKRDNFLGALDEFKNDEIEKLNLKNKDGKSSRAIKNISKTLGQVKKVFGDFVNKIYKDKTDNEKVLSQLNKIYTSKNILSAEQLSRTENIALLDEIFEDIAGNQNGNTTYKTNTEDERNKQKENTRALKKTLEYILTLSKILMKDYKTADELFNKLDNKARTQGLDAMENIQLISAFCVKHIKDQNKALRPEQLASVILNNYIGGGVDRNICKLATGTGKTLTLLFNMYNGGINGFTPITLTTNQLLVNEMIVDAEKISVFKGHIFYINEKQEFIDKTTNRVIPVSEIKEILKDTRNLVFSTYSNFDFWRKKMLLNNGSDGIEIVKHIAQKGQLGLDEVDSLVDPKTTNKISVSLSAEGMLNYDILKVIKTAIPDVKKFEDTLKTNNNFLNDSISNILDICFKKGILHNNSDREATFIENLLDAYIDANKMQLGVEYTVEKEGDTNVVYPIKGGAVDKSGSKYKSEIDLALKIKLQDEGYYFKDLINPSSVIQESCNFDIFKYGAKTLGVSGTINGVEELWQKNNFVVNNIQQTKPKLLKENVNNYFFCAPYDENKDSAVMELVLLANSYYGGKPITQAEIEAIFPELISKAKEQFFALLKNNDNMAKKNFDAFMQKLVETFNEDENKKKYKIVTFSDGKKLEKTKNNLVNNLRKLKKHGFDTGIEEEDLISLDSRNVVVDEKTIKDDLKENKNRIVFGLQDRSRGFDFPNDSHVISVDVNCKELDEQIRGRTGRNGELGTITYAYSFDGEYIYNEMSKENRDLCANENALFNFVSKQSNDTIWYNFLIKYIKKDKTEKIVNEFNRKHEFLSKQTEFGDKVSIFLNLLTEKLDKRKKQEVYEKAYVLIAKFQKELTDKFELLNNEKDDKIFFSNFSKQFLKSAELEFKNLLKGIYDRLYVVNKENEKQKTSFEYFEQEMHNVFSQIIGKTNKIQQDNKKPFDAKDVKIEDRQKLTNEHEKFIVNNENLDLLEIKQTNNKEEQLYFIGLLDSCEFNDIKTYRINGNGDNKNIILTNVKDGQDENYYFNSDIIIGKKQFLTEDKYGNLQTKEREVVFVDYNNILNNEDYEKVYDFIQEKIKDGAMVVVRNNTAIECLNNGMVKSSEQKFYDINVLIKQFATNGEVINKDDIEIKREKERQKIISKIKNTTNTNEEKAKLIEFLTKDEQEKTKKSLIKNGIQTLFNRNIIKENVEELGNESEQFKVGSEYINYYFNAIKNINNFSLELTKEEKKELDRGQCNLSNVIVDKINNKLNNANELKNIIKNDEFIDTKTKNNLLNNLEQSISNKNLEKYAKRSMNLVSSVAMFENVQTAHRNNEGIDNIDMFASPQENANRQDWQQNINFDNLDEVKNKLKVVADFSQQQEEVGEKIKKQCRKDEEKLKETISNQYNNVQSNLNLIDANINEMEQYKNYIESLKNVGVKFKSFDDYSNLSNIKIDLDDRRNKYYEYIARLDEKEKGYLSNEQRNYVLNQMIDANIDSTIRNVFNKDNLKFFFNELSVVSYDERDENRNPLIDYDNPDSLMNNGRVLNSVSFNILKEIKQSYKNIYGEFENIYKQDEEEKKLTKEQEKEQNEKYENFIISIKNILHKNRDEFMRRENKDMNYKFLPVHTYDLLNDFIDGLGKNYKKNKELKENLIQNIKENIVNVASFFENNKEVHGRFEEELLNYYKQVGVVGVDKNFDKGYLISNEGISKVIDEFYKLDISTLKKLNLAIEDAKQHDFVNAKRRVKEIINEKKELSGFVKFLLVFLTMGLILLTDTGKDMFKHEQKEIKNDIPDIKNEKLEQQNNIG